MTGAIGVIVLGLALFVPVDALAQSANSVSFPGLSIALDGEPSGREGVATAIRILLGLTVLSLAPAILVMMTSFTRIIVVLSILRHAFGMQQTPPNTVLIGLALFLTIFNMTPAFEAVANDALTPYLEGEIETGAALENGLAPMRDFMIRQTREEDLALMVEISGASFPNSVEEVGIASLIPAFLLSELRMAFQIGFVIFLPFLLIDIVVSTLLMSMGMLMVPPMMLSLPLKVLMFVLIDGWNLVVRSLMSSFA